jgi:hypothetical protein
VKVKVVLGALLVTSIASADAPLRVYAGSVVSDGMCSEVAAVYYVPAKTRMRGTTAMSKLRDAWEQAASAKQPGVRFAWSKSACMERPDFDQMAVRRMCRTRSASYNGAIRFESVTVEYVQAGGRCE